MATLKELKHTQGSAEWYTPPKYIRLVKEVLGGIDLDPASNAIANQHIQATRYFTREDNGLLHPWEAESVFLNAPGSSKRGISGQTQWGNYLLSEYRAGRVGQAIQLIFNVNPDTQWFQSLLGRYPICFVRGRIKFIPPRGVYQEGGTNSPTNASAFLYIGEQRECFRRVFRKVGKVAPAWEV